MSSTIKKPDCFNFDAIDDDFYTKFGTKINDYKTELGNNIKENGGNKEKYEKKTTFVNTYYLPIMYIIYSFIFKKFYDEQSKRQIIIYNIHQYNENRLLFDRQSPLVKKVNVFLNNKLSEEKKEEKEELESGIIQQIIENKDITVKFLENINEKLQKVIDLNKIHIKKYENFLNDLQTYSNKLDDVGKIEKGQAGGDPPEINLSSLSPPAPEQVQLPASGSVPVETFVMPTRNIRFSSSSPVPVSISGLAPASVTAPVPASKTLNKNISSIINDRLLQPTSTKKSNNTLIIKSKYEDLIKLQIKINLFLIMDNSDFTASLFIKTSNSTTIIAPIITAYTTKNQQILKMIDEYKKKIEMNIYLIKLFEDIKELYQDYLQQINNKRIQKTFFDKIIKKIKVIIYIIDKNKYPFTSNNETNINIVIKNNGYSKSQSGGYLNTENNLLPLINLIYDNIIQNIISELTYLSLNTPQKGQVASQNSSNPQNIIFNQKTKKIDFDLKLRQYLKEKKDIDKIIVQKLKEFKGDIDDNLKNISNELTLLKDPLTPENKTEKPRLNTIKIQLENNLKTEQNNLKLSKSQTDSYNEEIERLETSTIQLGLNQQKKSRLESSLEIQRQSLVKENKNYKLIEQKIATIMLDIKINEEKLNKIIQKENQYKYKKEILETKQTSYTNIKKEIDSNLSELEKPKEGLNNSTLKDLFNKTFNNLIQLTNNLSEINKKIQYKKSNNKISTLLDNDMLSKISLISKNALNNNNNKRQAIFIKKITNYYTIKESKKSTTNKNSSKIYIFMNSLLEEYNKIKDTKNTTVELFFQFIIKIDDELTKSIMKLLDKINQQKLKKINNYNEPKIQYLNTLSNKIKELRQQINTSGEQTSQNKINSAKQKSESKIKRILAYTDVIKLYFSNIIYLILYLSTYYL